MTLHISGKQQRSNLPGKPGLEVPRHAMNFYWQTKSLCRKAQQKFSEAATVTLVIVFYVTMDLNLARGQLGGRFLE